MTQQVTVTTSLRMQIIGFFLITMVGILLWFAFELRQVVKGHEVAASLHTAEIVRVVMPAEEVPGMCLPLLPVKLWNRDPATVPDPPPWTRVVV